MAEAETKSARAAKAAAQDAAAKMTDAASRTADKTLDAMFQIPSYDVPEMFRAASEQALSQTREAYSRLKGTAEEATEAMEDSLTTTRDGLVQIQVQALDAAKANNDATYDFVKKIMGITSFSDAVQIQTDFARERFDALVDYSKEMQASFGKVGSDAAKPAKVLFDRAVRQSKAP